MSSNPTKKTLVARRVTKTSGASGSGGSSPSASPGLPPSGKKTATVTKKTSTVGTKGSSNSVSKPSGITSKSLTNGAGSRGGSPKPSGKKKKTGGRKGEKHSTAEKNGRIADGATASPSPSTPAGSVQESPSSTPVTGARDSGNSTPVTASTASLRQEGDGGTAGNGQDIVADLPVVEPQEPVTEIHENQLPVWKGRLEKLPHMNSKIVRIFTSSTFTDTSLERNSLMKRVYPKLKEYCRWKHGFEFQVVDMRWGVRDEATDDHMTTALCLKELENCQRLSVGPNFIVFLGQKYGFRPIPTFIKADEFNMIRDVVAKTSNADLEMITTWYKIDENMIPPKMVLQPISSILVNFNNKRMQRLMEQDQNQWWDNMVSMQRIFRKATAALHNEGKINDTQKHNFYMSVTEREVIHGILEAPNVAEHTYCYLRTLENMNTKIVRVARNFIDFNGLKVDDEAQSLLSLLKDKKLPTVLPESRISKLSIPWSDEGGTNGDDEIHGKYLDDFCSHFYDTIVDMIESGVTQLQNLSSDRNFTETLQHLHACRNFCKVFQGREDIIEKIHSYILDPNNNQVLVIHGESGCGKTSLLAKAASYIVEWLGDRVAVVIRFLGTSPDSSTLSPLLTSLCRHIALLYGEPESEIPTELPKLILHVRALLQCATAERPLVLFLDSLDQLSDADGAHALGWLPDCLPPHVHLLVSTLPGYYGILETLHTKIEREENFIEITPLGQDLSATILRSWLKSANRTINSQQWTVVNKALEKCNLPLFVKLVFDDICRWRSYHTLNNTTLSYTIQDSIHNLFTRIENQHGKILVTHAFSYITASKSGLSEAELEDILSLDEKVLNDVYQYHIPPARRIPPLLWTRIRNDLPGYLSEREADGVNVINWYHRQFIDVARQRYFKNLNFKEAIHHTLSDYYLGKWSNVEKPFEYEAIHLTRRLVHDRKSSADRRVPSQPFYFLGDAGNIVRFNLRKLSELPFNLLRANRYEELFDECLFNFNFLHAKLSCMPLQSLLKDLQDLLQIKWDRDTKILLDTLRLSASVITRYPGMLGPQVAGRLLPYYGSHARIRKLIQQCDTDGLERCALMPANHCLHTPGGPLEYSLEGHLFAPYGLQVTEDGQSLVSVTNQLIVWCMDTGDTLRTVQPNGLKGIMQGLYMAPGSKMAVAFSNTNQLVYWHIDSGDYSLEANPFDSADGDIIGAMMSKEIFILWTRSAWIFIDTASHQVAGRGTLGPDSKSREVMSIVFQTVEHFWIVLRHLDIADGGEEDDMSLAHCGDLETAFDFHHAMALTQDGGCLYACIAISDNDIALYNWQGSWDYQRSIDNTEKLLSLSLSHDETILVGVIQSGFKLWKLKKRDASLKLALPQGVRNIPSRNPFVNLIIFSKTREYMIAAVRSKIYVYSTFSGSLSKTFDAHFGRVVSLISVHKTNRVISGSMDKTIKVWNFENIMERVFPIDRMDKAIEAISLATHVNLCATRTRNGIGIWNLNTGRLTHIFSSGGSAIITDLFLTADGRHVVSLEARAAILWETDAGKQLCEEPQSGSALALVPFEAEGRCFCIYRPSESSTAAHVVARSLTAPPTFPAMYEFEYQAAHFVRPVITADGKTFVAASGTRADSLESLMLYNTTTGASTGHVTLKVATGGTYRALVAMPHDVHQVALVKSDVDGDSSAVLWDIKKKSQLRSLPLWNGECTSTGKLGLCAPSRGGLHLLSLKKGDAVRVLIPKVAEGVFVNRAFFTRSDNHVVYYHSGHRQVRVFRTSDGKCVGIYRAQSALGAFEGTPGGFSLVLGGEDGSLNVVTIADPQFETNTQFLHSLSSRQQELDVSASNPTGSGTGAGGGVEDSPTKSTTSPSIGASLRIAQMVARQRINKVQNSKACVVS